MAGRWTADRRLYLDKDGAVVEADDPTRVSLLVGVGGTLTDADATRYGLIDEKGQTVARPNKASAGPAENKASKPPRNHLAVIIDSKG